MYVFHFDPTKSDPNDPDNRNEPTRLQCYLLEPSATVIKIIDQLNLALISNCTKIGP